MSKGRRVAKGCGLGCGGLVVLLLVVAAVLMIWKPWAPEIVVVEPGPGGERISDAGLLGNYYRADGDGRPAVLVLGGSEGGISDGPDGAARALREKGYSALALSYWGGPGQKPRMEDLPLETFDTAIEWLKKQPEVDPKRLAIMGASKGGEASVVVGSRHPDIKATVGYVPSHVVWQGLDQAEPWRLFTGMSSTWSAAGQPLPYVPYSEDFRGGPLVELYRMSLQNVPAHQDAIIPVEKAAGPMLLVCGGVDTMWPSCDMSDAVRDRAAAENGRPVSVLDYPQAGHLIFGPPLPADSPFRARLAEMGGTVESNSAALEDSWPKVLAFLEKNLRS